MIIRDYCFSCAMRRLAEAIVNDTESAYLYHFTFKDGNRPIELLLGVFHSAELAYVFDNPPTKNNFTGREKEMASTMGELWTSFATNGVPTSSLAPSWPAYTPDKDVVMTLDVPSVLQTGFLAKECAFWDRLALWDNPYV